MVQDKIRFVRSLLWLILNICFSSQASSAPHPQLIYTPSTRHFTPDTWSGELLNQSTVCIHSSSVEISEILSVLSSSLLSMLRPTRTKRRPASRQKKTATGARKNEGPCWTLRWKDGQREAFWWRVNWSRVSRTWIHIRYITTTMNRHTPNRHTGNSAGHSASDRYKIYRHNNQALQENQECNGSKNARWHLQFKYFYSFYKTSVAAFLSWCVSVKYCVVCFVLSACHLLHFCPHSVGHV